MFCRPTGINDCTVGVNPHWQALFNQPAECTKDGHELLRVDILQFKQDFFQPRELLLQWFNQKWFNKQ